MPCWLRMTGMPPAPCMPRLMTSTTRRSTRWNPGWYGSATKRGLKLTPSGLTPDLYWQLVGGQILRARDRRTLRMRPLDWHCLGTRVLRICSLHDLVVVVRPEVHDD